MTITNLKLIFNELKIRTDFKGYSYNPKMILKWIKLLQNDLIFKITKFENNLDITMSHII